VNGHRYIVRRPADGLYAVHDRAEERVVFGDQDRAAVIREAQRRNGWHANGDDATYAAQVRNEPWRR
jgi:hypothetical protein